MSVLVVGSMAFDSIETPHGRADRVLGGSAAYFALAAAFFAPVRIVGVVGQDFPEDHLAALSRSGVDLEGLQRAEGKTFYWHGRYHEDLNVRDTLEVQLNVLENFVPHMPPGYEDTEYAFLGNMHPDAQMDVMSRLKRPRLVALRHHGSLDPGEPRRVAEGPGAGRDRGHQRLGSAHAQRRPQHRPGGARDSQDGASRGPHQARRVRRVPVLR